MSARTDELLAEIRDAVALQRSLSSKLEERRQERLALLAVGRTLQIAPGQLIKASRLSRGTFYRDIPAASLTEGSLALPSSEELLTRLRANADQRTALQPQLDDVQKRVPALFAQLRQAAPALTADVIQQNTGLQRSAIYQHLSRK